MKKNTILIFFILAITISFSQTYPGTMLDILGGTFIMGNNNQPQMSNDQDPEHSVTIDDFIMGETEVSNTYYIISEDIGGAMFWEFSSDKFSHLLNVINYVFNQESFDNIIGDFNNDEIINVLDVIILVEHILSPATVELDGADINDDGNVDVIDIILLVNLILN